MKRVPLAMGEYGRVSYEYVEATHSQSCCVVVIVVVERTD